jgi:hypothetical protein
LPKNILIIRASIKAIPTGDSSIEHFFERLHGLAELWPGEKKELASITTMKNRSPERHCVIFCHSSFIRISATPMAACNPAIIMPGGSRPHAPNNVSGLVLTGCPQGKVQTINRRHFNDAGNPQRFDPIPAKPPGRENATLTVAFARASAKITPEP